MRWWSNGIVGRAWSLAFTANPRSLFHVCQNCHPKALLVLKLGGQYKTKFRFNERDINIVLNPDNRQTGSEDYEKKSTFLGQKKRHGLVRSLDRL